LTELAINLKSALLLRQSLRWAINSRNGFVVSRNLGRKSLSDTAAVFPATALWLERSPTSGAHALAAIDRLPTEWSTLPAAVSGIGTRAIAPV